MKKILVFVLMALNLFSIERIKLSHVDNIVKPEGNGIKGITYNVNGISLEDKVVSKKKENFINLILPSIIKAKKDIDYKRNKVEGLFEKNNIDPKEEEWLGEIYKEYKVEGNNKEELVKRLKTVPVDLALAQAIVESGWGTSRFFREGNNVYGIWSFNEKDKRMEASHGVRNGKKVYLKKYDYVYECAKDYFYSLAVGYNYKQLREKLVNTQDSLELSEELTGYSEIGDEYVKRIKSIIKYNKLKEYNKYELLN